MFLIFKSEIKLLHQLNVHVLVNNSAPTDIIAFVWINTGVFLVSTLFVLQIFFVKYTSACMQSVLHSFSSTIVNEYNYLHEATLRSPFLWVWTIPGLNKFLKNHNL